jgi:hypothetical protein
MMVPKITAIMTEILFVFGKKGTCRGLWFDLFLLKQRSIIDTGKNV